jgi:hypothetical protein
MKSGTLIYFYSKIRSLLTGINKTLRTAMLRLIRNGWELVQTAATRTLASLFNMTWREYVRFVKDIWMGFRNPLRVDYRHTYTVEAIMRMSSGARALWERFLNGSQENVQHGYPIETGSMKCASW